MTRRADDDTSKECTNAFNPDTSNDGDDDAAAAATTDVSVVISELHHFMSESRKAADKIDKKLHDLERRWDAQHDDGDKQAENAESR